MYHNSQTGQAMAAHTQEEVYLPTTLTLPYRYVHNCVLYNMSIYYVYYVFIMYNMQ